MNNLFRSSEPDRAQLLVHLTLGFAAVLAVVSAVTTMVEFSANRDRIAAALSTEPTGVVGSKSGERNSLTNVTNAQLTPPDSGSALQTNPPALEPVVSRKTELPTG